MHSYYLAKVLYKLRISSYKSCKISKLAKVDAQCVLAYVNIGKYSYVASETHITNTIIGNFVSIGGGCQIGGGMHPLEMVSTSPVFLNGKNILKKNFAKINYKGELKVTIGNDVWIGDGCYIKAGVTIGSGAIVGAHSVVTRDVEPYTIVAGVPARLLRNRFSKEIADSLLNLAWWNWSDDIILSYADYFDNPVKLLNAVQTNPKTVLNK